MSTEAYSVNPDQDIYHAVCEYRPQESDELHLREDEPVHILDQGDFTYCLVRSEMHGKVKTGWVPICILEKRAPTLADEQGCSVESSLNRSTSDDLLRRERLAVEDMLEGEREYVSELQYFIDIIENVIDNDQKCPTIVKSTRSILLGTAKQLLRFHQDVLFPDLSRTNNDANKIANVFVRNNHQFHLYVDYFSDMNICEMTLDNHKQIVNYLDNVLYRFSGNKEKPLMYYLTRPIERLEMYRVLIKDIIRFAGRLRTDIRNLVYAFGVINNIFNQIRFHDTIDRARCLPCDWKSWGDVQRQEIVMMLEEGKWVQKELLLFKMLVAIFSVVDNGNVHMLFDKIVKLNEIMDIKDGFDNDAQQIQIVTKYESIRIKLPNVFLKLSLLRTFRSHLSSQGLQVNNCNDASKGENIRTRKYRFEEYAMVQSSSTEDISNASSSSCSQSYATKKHVGFVEKTNMQSGETESLKMLTDVEMQRKRCVLLEGNKFYSDVPPVLPTMYTSNSLRLGRLTRPMFSKKLINLHVKEGSEVSLDCTVECEAEISASWMHNNRPIVAECRRVTGRRQSNIFFLRIKNVSMMDAGTYSVTIANSAGSVSCSCRLYVADGGGAVVSRGGSECRSIPITRHHTCTTQRTEQYTRSSSAANNTPQRSSLAPYFIQPLRVCQNSIELVTLECRLSCSSEANMQWFKDNELIVPDNSKYITRADSSTRTVSLSINSPTSSDSGQYGLKVWDSYGETCCSTAFVEVKKGFTHPLFERYECFESDCVEFRVRHTSTVQRPLWLKDSRPLDLSSGRLFVERMMDPPDDNFHTLTITKATRSDSGLYTVSFVGEDGECDTCSSTLSVLSGERRSLPPVKFRSEICLREQPAQHRAISVPVHRDQSNQSIVKPLEQLQNEPLTLHLQTAKPISTVEFRKDGVKCEGDGMVRIIGGCDARYTVHSPNESDLGTYCCTVDGIMSSELRVFQINNRRAVTLVHKLPNRIDVKEGESVTIGCEFNCVPRSVLWMKDSVDVRKLDKITILADNVWQGLRIERAEREKHAGRYRLFVNDQFMDETFVVVIGLPVEPPSELVDCQIGASLNIPCKVSADMYGLRSDWYEDDKRLVSDGVRYSFASSDCYDRSLNVSSITRSATFKLIAYDGDQKVLERNTKVMVSRRSSRATALAQSSSPSVTAAMDDSKLHRVMEGDTVTIAISEAASDQLILLKDGQPLENRCVDGTIVIDDLQIEDAGYYSFVTETGEHPIGHIVVDKRPIQREFMSLARSSFIFGETIYLECEFQSEPHYPVIWYKNSAPLLARPDHVQNVRDKLVHSLTIPKCSRSDEGTYELRSGSFILTTPHITVIDPFDLKNIQVLRVNDTLNIDVKTNTALKQGSVRIFHDNEDITEDGSVKLDVKKCALAICVQNVSFKHSGSYYMETEDGCRLHLCTVQVISSLPALRYVPRYVERVPIGDPVDICFESSTSINAEPVWFKDGVELTRRDGCNTEMRQNRMTLTFEQIRSEDGGVYSVRTADGLECEAAQLFVYEPEIKQLLQARTVFVGDCVEVEVRDVCGKQVTLSKNGKPIDVGADQRIELRRTKEDGVSFRLNDVKLSDRGLFEICVDGEARYMFNVNVEPRLVQPLRLDRCEFNEGESITLDCVFEKCPPGQELKWYRNNQPLKADHRFAFRRVTPDTYTLVIKDCRLSDSGVYQLKNDSNCFETQFLTIIPADGSSSVRVAHQKPLLKTSDMVFKAAGGMSLPAESVVSGKIVERIVGMVDKRSAKLVEAKEGESINIQLDTKGQLLNENDVCLMRNGVIVRRPSEERIKWVIENTALSVTISDLVLSDSGIWSIVLGDQTIPAIDLTVSERPRHVKLLHLKKTEFAVNETFRLDVDVKGKLSGTPVWRKNGRIIRDSDPIRIETDGAAGRYTLLIPSIQNEHSGVYSLTLDNLELVTPPIVAKAPSKPEIKVINATEGERISFRLPYKWMDEGIEKDGVKVRDGIVSEREGDFNLITFPELKLNQAGVYSVAGKPFLELRVNRRPPVKFAQLEVKKTVFNEGETLSIPFHRPSLLSDWARNGEKIRNDRTRVDSRGSLCIDDLKVDDSGIYSISSPDGTLFSTSSITVQHSIQTIDAYEHENVQVTLKIPDVTDDLQVTRDSLKTEKTYIQLVAPDTVLVKVSDLELCDSGLYEIVMGDDRIPFLKMNVLKRPLLYRRLELPQTSFSEGDTLLIKLEHELNESPTWTKDGKLLTPGDDDRISMDTDGTHSTLTISPLRTTDSGHISVSIGNVIFDADPLIVREDPVRFLIPFHLAIRPDRPGDLSEFRCSFNRPVDRGRILIVKHAGQEACADRFIVSQSEKCFTFRMTDTRLEDVEEYQCSLPPLLSSPVPLSFAEDSSFLNLKPLRNSVLEGEPIEIICEIGPGIDPSTVSLFKTDTQKSGCMARVSYEENGEGGGGRIVFRADRAQKCIHDGIYQAFGEFKGISISSEPVRVSVSESRLSLTISCTHPYECDRVEFSAELAAENVDIRTVKLMRDGVAVDEAKVFVDGSKVKAVIERVKKSDIGEYRMVWAENGRLTTLPARLVDVLAISSKQTAPAPLKKLQLSANKTCLSEDEILILNCQHSGTVEWYKDGLKVESNDGDAKITRERVDDSIELLILNELSSERDSGVYTVKTDDGATSNPVAITVKESGPGISFVSPFTADRNVLNQSECVQFTCTLSEEPASVEIVGRSSKLSDVRIIGRDVIGVLTNAQPSDTGSYKCVVNGGELEAIVPIRVDQKRPEVEVDEEGAGGERIRLTCVSTHPDEKVPNLEEELVWIRDDGKKEVMVGSGSNELIVEEPSGPVQYTCSVNGRRSLPITLGTNTLAVARPLSVLNKERPVEGEDVCFELILTRPPEGKLVLKKNGKEIDADFTTMNRPGGTVVLATVANISLQDSGEYSICGKGIKEDGGRVMVQVQRLRAILTSEKNVLNPSDKLNLKCEFNRELSADEMKNVIILKNDCEQLEAKRSPIDSSTVAFTCEPSSATYVAQLNALKSNGIDVVVRSEDEGLYFTSPLQSNKKNVQSKEKLVLSIKLNRTARFEDLTFLRNGHALPDDRMYMRASNELCYVIEEAEHSDGPGLYECRINPTGQVSNQIKVDFDDSSISIIEPLQNVTVNANCDFSLSCRFSKPLDPSNTHFRWLKDGKELSVAGAETMIDFDVIRILLTNAQPNTHQGVWRIELLDLPHSLVCEGTVNVRRQSTAQGFRRPLPPSAIAPLQLLSCESLRAEKSVVWTLNGEPLSGAESSKNGLVHTINLADIDEPGELVCTLSNGQKTVCELKKPNEDDIKVLCGFAEELTALPGDRLDLTCILSAASPADLCLAKDGDQVDSDVQRMADEDCEESVRFRLNSIRKSDAGLYTLYSPSNPQLRSQCRLKVIGDEQPRITKPLTSKRAKVGASVSFEVETSSSMAPGFWKKDGQPLTQMKPVILRDGNKHRLIIPSLKFEDSGTVSFEVGEQVSKASLTVLPEPDEQFIDRTLFINPKPALEGDNVEVSCTITDPYEASPVWFKDGIELKGKAIKMDQHNCSIVLEKCSKERDEGVYSVRLANGDELSDRVEIVTGPARFIKPLADVKIRRGEICEVQCETDKNVKVEWFKDGRKIGEDEGQVHKMSGEAGSYRCKISDESGPSTQCQVSVIDGDLSFVRKLHDIFVEEGEPFILEVELSRVPNEKPVWKRDCTSVKIPDELKNEYELVKDKALFEEDSGLYEFSVEDISCIGRLTVTKPILSLLKPLQLMGDAIEGFKVVLKCLYSKRPDNVRCLTATKSGKEPLMDISDDGTVMCTIDNLTLDDSGKYVVEATDSAGLPLKTSLNLKVKPSRQLVVKLSGPEMVREGESIELNCEANVPLSAKQFQWMFNKRPVRDGRISFKSNSSALVVPNADKSDEGLYECIVLGEAYRKSVKVQDSSAKVIEELACYGARFPGSSVSLQAKLNKPVTSVTFLKDGKVIKGGWVHGPLVGLDIANLSEADVGAYSVQIDGSSDYLLSLEQPSEEPLRLISPLCAEKARLKCGQKAVLKCKLNRKPENTSGNWLVNGLPLTIDGIKNSVHYMDDGTVLLTISDLVEDEDSGKYTFKLLNISTTCSIDVAKKLILALTYTPKPAIEHDHVVLSCPLLSEAAASPVWYRNGKRIDGGRMNDSGLATLDIPDCKLSDAGHYRIEVNEEEWADCELQIDAKNEWVQRLAVEGVMQLNGSFELRARSRFACKQVQWYLNGVLLKNPDVSVDGSVYTLKIKAASIQDFGEYKIEADTLEDVLAMEPENEFIVPLLHDGQKFSCETLLPGKAKWYRNGVFVEEEKQSSKEHVLRDKNCRGGDEYVCQVDNISDSYRVTEIGQPWIEGEVGDGKCPLKIKAKIIGAGDLGGRVKLVRDDGSDDDALAVEVKVDKNEIVALTRPIVPSDYGMYLFATSDGRLKSPAVEIGRVAELRIEPPLVKEGELCRATATFNRQKVKEDDVCWKINGIPVVKLNERFRTFSNKDGGGGTCLEILKCKLSDSGKISCVLLSSAKDGQRREISGELKVIEGPLRLKEPLHILDPASACEGSSATFKVVFSRKPKYFKLYRGDKSALDSNRLNCVEKEGVITFEISNLDRSLDTGMYKIVAEDSVESSCCLKVEIPELQVLKDLHLLKRPVLEGDESFCLSIQLNRSPLQYKWLKDSVPIDDDDDRFEEIIDDNEYKLVLKSPVCSDTGTYEYFAEGHVRSVEKVTVRSMPLTSITPLHFEDTVLSIKLNRAPSQKPRLLKNGKKLSLEPECLNGNEFVYRFDRLNKPDDEGLYMFEVDDFGESTLLQLPADEANRIISGPPAEIELNEGEELMLSVLISAGQAVDIEWMKKRGVRVKSDRVPLNVTHKSVFKKSAVSMDDAGVYVCSVNGCEFETNVKVNRLISVDDVSVWEGERAVMKVDEPNAIWTDAMGRKLTSAAGELVFAEAKLTDGGVYWVKIGSQKTSARLSVRPITVIEPLKNREVGALGDDVVLVCEFSSCSAPVSWMKGSSCEPIDDKHTIDFVVDSEKQRRKCFLTIRNFKEEDVGEYSAVCGSALTSATITLANPDGFRERFSSVSVKEGEPFCLKAIGNAMSNALITHEDEVDDRFVFSDPETAQLSVKKAELGDAGLYKCVLAEGHECKALVTVVPIESLKILNGGLKDKVARVGDKDIEWTVETNRDLKGLKPVWLRNGEILPHVDGLCLTIDKVEPSDFGLYELRLGDLSTQCLLQELVDSLYFVKELEDQWIGREQKTSVVLSVRLNRKPDRFVWKMDGKGIDGGISDESGSMLTLKIKDNPFTFNQKKSIDVSVIVEDRLESKAKLHLLESEALDYEFVVPLTSKKALLTGDNVMFKCKLNRKVDCEPQWTLGGQLIDTDRFIPSIENDWCLLEVKDVVLADEGRLECRVHDAVTSGSLTVTEPKKQVISPLNHLEVMEGEDAVFEATLTRPDASTKWFKDDDEDKESAHFAERDGKVQRLTIKSAKLSDAGWYRLEFDDGSDFSQAKLKVNPLPLLLMSPLKDVSVKVGDEFVLECTVTGMKREYDVQWTKDSRSVQGSIYFQTANEARLSLIVSKAKLKHAGRYRVCVKDLQSQCNVQVLDDASLILGPMPDVSVMEHEMAEFECNVSKDVSKNIVAWYRNGNELLTPSNRVRCWTDDAAVDGFKLKMSIRDARKSDEGDYVVRVDDKMECKAFLSVECVTAKFLSGLPAHYLLAKNEPFKLTTVLSDEGVEVEWFKDGIPIGKDVNVSTDRFSHSLEMANAIPGQDEGVYSVRLPSGEESLCHCRFQEEHPPRIVEPFADMRVGEADGFELRCKVENATADMDVAWFRNGKRLVPSVFLSTTIVGEDVCVLSVRECSLEDEGKYRCVVSNRLGSDFCESFVNIVPSKDAKDEQRIGGAPPCFIQTPTDVQVSEGRMATLSAIISGRPDPEVQWIRENCPVDPERCTISRDPINKMYSITLKVEDENDIGEYSCVAKNPFGEEIAWATVSLLKSEKPLDSDNDLQIAPSFIRKPRNLIVADGDPAKFDMFVSGLPLPSITWTKDGKTIDNPTQPADNGKATLIVASEANVDDSGTYEVFLENPAGSCHCRVQLSVLDGAKEKKKKQVMFNLPNADDSSMAPLPPTSPSISPETCKLSWTHSLSRTPETPLTYIVESKDESGEWVSYQSNIAGCSLELTNPDRLFRIRAQNEAGLCSEPSPIATVPHIPRKDSSMVKVIGEDIQYYVIGQQAKLEVLCVGPLKITGSEWTRDDGRELDQRYHFNSDVLGYQTLTIDQSVIEDEGPYTVNIFQNDLQSIATHKIYLEPADPPVILEPFKDTACETGQSFSLTCKIDGIPYPDVKFFKDWLPIAESHRIKIEKVDAETWKLTLSNAILKDTGLYSCMATNMAGSAITSALVSVQEDTLNIGRTDLHYKFQAFKNKMFEEDFADDSLLVEQGLGRVVERSTGKAFRAKIINNNEDFEREKHILGSCFHAAIVELYAAYEQGERKVLVFEDTPGSHLADYLQSKDQYDEDLVAKIISQLLYAVEYLHARNIAHLSLTPDNIIIDDSGDHDDDDCQLKLVGFSNAHAILGTVKAYCDRIENVEYASPELLRKQPVGLPMDMFSIGSITYSMLTGKSPFKGESEHDTVANVCDCNWTRVPVSNDALDFMEKLLEPDPFKRMSVKQALAHPFIKYSGQRTSRDVLLHDRRRAVSAFNARSRSRSRDDRRARSTPRKFLVPIVDSGLAVRLRGYRRHGFRGSDYLSAERCAYPNTVHERAWRFGDDPDLFDRFGRHSILSAPAPLQNNLQFFNYPLENKAFVIGQRIVLKCQIKPAHQPDHRISWFRDNKFIGTAAADADGDENGDGGGRIRIERHDDGTQSLTIKRCLATDAGQYSCLVSRESSVEKSTCTLVLGEIPDKPSRPTIVDYGAGQVHLSWDAPTYLGNCKILGYEIQCRPEGDLVWVESATTTNQESCILSNLKSMTEYRFRVCCVSDVGRSPYSTASEVLLMDRTDPLDRETVNHLLLNQSRTLSETIVDNQTPYSSSEPNGLEAPWETYIFCEEISRSSPNLVKLKCEKRDEQANNPLHTIFSGESITLPPEGRHFVKVHEWYHEPTTMITTIISKMDLLECCAYICTKQKYREQLVSDIISQTLDALIYLHNNLKIPHLNIHMGSIMLENRVQPHVRLGEIHGHSVANNHKQIEYSAPELLSGSADISADIWSLGCVLFTLLSAKFPFEGDSDQETIENVLSNRIDFVGNSFFIYENATSEAIDFIIQCMNPKTNERPTAVDCRYSNRWLSHELTKDRNNAIFLSDKMKVFCTEFKLKRYEQNAQNSQIIDSTLQKLSRKR